MGAIKTQLKGMIFTVYATIRDVYFSLPWKLAYLLARRRCAGLIPVALFFPAKPTPHHSIYKVLHNLGCRITVDPRTRADLVVRFQPATVARDTPIPHSTDPRCLVLNNQCLDISKQRVDAVFRNVFGYGSLLDPRSHTGSCVCKSDENALHDGIIIDCPVTPMPGCVYQILINNLYDDLVQDIRVPVVGRKIPFVYVKYRPVTKRFSVQNTRVDIWETCDVLSEQEVELVLKFAALLGLDFGELDVLRDRDSGHLYIIDATNTPYGPPNHLARASSRASVRRLSKAFRYQFLSETRSG